MKKRNLFAELTEGFEALKAEREGKITLRKVHSLANLRHRFQRKMYSPCAKNSISPAPFLLITCAPTHAR